MSRELWVCFELPAAEPPTHTHVLSFLPPALEEEAERRWSVRVVSGRALVQEVRPHARAMYLDLIARLGSTPIEGRTLRQVLAVDGRFSRWWFVKTSEKDCEWPDDLYVTVLRLSAVKAAADRFAATAVVVFGGSRQFAEIVRGAWAPADEPARVPWRRRAAWLAAGLVGRLGLLASYVRVWLLLLRFRARRPAAFDVLLHAQWGWTVRLTPTGDVRDGYFRELPSALRRRGLRVGWLASCEPGTSASGRTDKLHDAIRASRRPDVVIFERYLGITDIVRAALDFRLLIRAMRFTRAAAFRELCAMDRFDLSPVLREQILGLLAGPGTPRLELIALGASRACAEARPRAVLTFLELILQSRAIYVAARAWGGRPAVWAAQHAAYGRDKLFGVVDAKRELRGEPDGLGIPAPDGIFVMGDVSRDIWTGNGLPAERVLITGGLRYQHVRISRSPAATMPRAVHRLLLIGSLDEAADLDMCEAVVAAAGGNKTFDLVFRDHPARRRTGTPAFRPFEGRVRPSSSDLVEDIDAAHVVIFNHSSVAEEAVLRGVPAWQWLWAGVNESAFLDLPLVPCFTSVRDLRAALEAFHRDPGAFAPTAEVQETVWRRCFGPAPHRAADRIAAAVEKLIGATRRSATTTP
jgi:surface carbohydrate biosynthesis protein (TIGR04326 family)